MANSELRAFKPIGDYALPPMPTEQTAKRWWRKLRHALGSDVERIIIGAGALKCSEVEQLDAVAPSPAFGPVQDELQSTLQDWLADEAPSGWLKLVVLPPCDDAGVLENWATEQGHSTLEAPSRADLLSGDKKISLELAEAFSGESRVLVIPRLERWFIRHRDGLTHLRALLDALDGLEQHCVIGCNSWAWAFVQKAVGAERILPTGMTFQSFDEPRLRRWLAGLASAASGTPVTFRHSRTGQDVFKTVDDSDEGAEPISNYMKSLAAESYGIPWVAWHVWRQSLRDAPGDDENRESLDELAVNDGETLWVVEPDELILPETQEGMALLILHAILIHGELTISELARVLPSADHMNVVAALSTRGFVTRRDGRIRCVPAAYPAIRRALSNAGFPSDRL